MPNIPLSHAEILRRIRTSLTTLTGPSLPAYTMALAQGIGDGLKAHAMRERLEIRVSSSWCRSCRITAIRRHDAPMRHREVAVGRQVIVVHVWDAPRTVAILANGHTLVSLDPVGGTARRRQGDDDETTALADGVPIHDLGFGSPKYEYLLAESWRINNEAV